MTSDEIIGDHKMMWQPAIMGFAAKPTTVTFICEWTSVWASRTLERRNREQGQRPGFISISRAQTETPPQTPHRRAMVCDGFEHQRRNGPLGSNKVVLEKMTHELRLTIVELVMVIIVVEMSNSLGLKSESFKIGLSTGTTADANIRNCGWQSHHLRLQRHDLSFFSLLCPLNHKLRRLGSNDRF